MERALITAGKGAELIVELLQSQGRYQIATASSGAQARRMLLEIPYDLTVINTPLSDENGIELSIEAAANNQTGVLLLTRAQYVEEISARVEEYGVFVVEKPIHKPFFYRALSLVHASSSRLRGLESQRSQLQIKIEEIRLIDRAKYTLIQYLGMTEPQAHRYIEKQAMDMRRTKRQIAEGILKTYEG
ncbi:ANTAR domain-containing protein [Oscillospiraceae bacterium MB08-C2-2]|nr:ANTAR domain-containing protein [Oscillospiraceae bacterium MB08-C2-2]